MIFLASITVLFCPAVSTGLGIANNGSLVINEIMNNPSAVPDADGEWFELFNPTAGDIDINGWTIQDNDFDFHVIDNGGPLVIAGGGYLVLGINADPGTNGGVSVDYEYDNFFLGNSGNEIVLLDAAMAEIDRVEYDGGVTFPDPTGASMALRDPALDNSLGANWCTASTPYGAGDLGTPGAANDCPALAELVINEIMNNPSAVPDADGEWFELFNPTAGDIDINGWTIQDNDFDFHVINNGGPLVITGGGYLVLGINADPGVNGGVSVDYEYDNFLLGNSGNEIVLLDAGLTEIDRVEYDGGVTFPDPTGASMALRDPALDNSLGANWCTASTPYGEGDLGTPGEANDCPELFVVVINEIMNNPSAVPDADGEWFELFNPMAGDIDINGWTIQDNDYDFHVINNGGPLVIASGGYLVLGINADPGVNGGVMVDYAYDNFFLGNSGNEIVLLDGNLTEVDRVEYDNGVTFPDPNGASMALRDPALPNHLGANWCTASTPYGDGDLGTPGEANDCPEVSVIINEIMNNPSAVPDGDGEWFELFNPTAGDIDINSWTIQDNDFDFHVINNGGPLVIAGSGYLVLGINADTGTNGGVSVDYEYDNFFLGNSGNEIVLIDAGMTEVDRVEYDGGVTFPDPTGASMALWDPALDNSLGSNWCTASTPYGDGDLGTPGAVNDCPPLVIAIDIEKLTNGVDADDPPGPAILVGDPVTWEYFVSNTGNVDLINVTVTDNVLGLICVIGNLPAGGTTICTAVGTAVAGQYENLGTAAGDFNGLTVSDEDPSHYFGADPGIDIEKWTNGIDADDPTGPEIPVGDPVTWEYFVTNTGNIALTNVTVTDDILGPICTIDSLDPGDTTTCTAVGTAMPGQYENLGTASCDFNGYTFTDEDYSHYLGFYDLSLDIKPGSCPNSFNPGNMGFLPVALPGTMDFDATMVDLSTVMLSRTDGVGGFAVPHEGPPGPHSVFEDVATPFDGEPCDCHELEGDGYMDLSMKFSSFVVAEALELESLEHATQVELVLTGTLMDGTLFVATDCIRIAGHGPDGDSLLGEIRNSSGTAR